MLDMGIAFTIRWPQYLPLRAAVSSTRLAPPFPSRIPRINIRRRSNSSTRTSLISAIARVKSMLASRKVTVSPALSATQAAVPTPGAAAAPPRAAPVPVIAARYWFSKKPMVSPGDAVGRLLHWWLIADDTIGRWT